MKATEKGFSSIIYYKNGSISVNPLGLFGIALTAWSATLAWLMVSVFVVLQYKSLNLLVDEAVIQSTLLDISMGNAGISLPYSIHLISLVILMVISAGSILSIFRRLTGATLTLAGTLFFLMASVSQFGSLHQGATVGYISPGMGPFVSLAGVALIIMSKRYKEATIIHLIRGINRFRNLILFGAYFGITFLTLDIVYHLITGQPNALLGSNMLESLLHFGIYGSLLSFPFIVLRQKVPRFLAILGPTLAFLFMASDIIYDNFYGFSDLIGHSLLETLFHLGIYYSIVVAFGSLLLAKGSPLQKQNIV
jgi:hypothetical protein